MKKSFSKTIAVLLAVLMVVCSLPMTVFAADASRSNVQLQFGAYCANDSENHQTYEDFSFTGFDQSGLNTAKLDYNKATGTITEASSNHTYGVGDFFTVSVLLENTSSLAAAQVGVKYSDNIVPAAVDSATASGALALVEASGVNEVTPGFAPYEAITSQSGNEIYNTASSTVGEISYIDADAKTMWANFAVQDGSDAVDLSSAKTVGVNTYTNTAVLATFGFKIVSDGAVTFSLADSKDVDSAYYVETIANGGKVEEYKTYTQTDYDGSTALDFMGDNENIESKKYTIKFVDENGATISEAEYAEGATVTVPALPAAKTISDAQHNTYAWDKEPSLTATADATYTAVPTAEDHKWNAGEKQNDGSTLYTCTVCGATKSETAHVHTWSEWTYNGDAEYTSASNYKDGTASRHCTAEGCNETETKTIANTGLFRARSANASFGAEILMNVGTRTAQVNAFDEVYCKFTREDGVETDVPLSKASVSGSNTMFPYGVTPQSMSSAVKITYYGKADGILVWGPEYTYTMTTNYIVPQLNKSTSEVYKKFLVELMYYGAAAQVYNNWKTDKPMTDELTDEQKALHDTSDLTLTNITNTKQVEIANAKTTWRAVNVEYGSVTVMLLKTKAYTPTDDLKAVVQVAGEPQQRVYYYSENPEYFVEENGGICFRFEECNANKLRSAVDVTLYEGDTAITNTIRYSVESYCATRKDGTTIYPFTQQLMRYANAAIAQFGN